MCNSVGWYLVFSWRGNIILKEHYRSARQRCDKEQMVAAVLDPGTYWVRANTLDEALLQMRETLDRRESAVA